jgi:putative two-component system response regulator
MSGEACNIDHLNISPGPFWLPMINRLTSQGFNVIAVADGPSALLEITKLPADPVLMDVLMPNLNGFEACEQIKANPDTHPVILVPALSDRQDRLEGVRVGADDFLSRPVDRTELMATVRSLLELKHPTDELERGESVLFTLARSIQGKDPYTHVRCERLSGYSARLGEHLA